MKYLTVGTRELKEELLYPVEDIEDPSTYKPRGGLWLTEQYDDCPTYNRWVDYILEHPNIFYIKNTSKNIWQQPCSLVSLRQDSKIFLLDSPEKHNYLLENYPYKNIKFSYEDLSQHYDGIFVDLLNVRNLRKDIITYEKYDKFSINSLILFNLNCIDYYQSGIVDIEPFEMEMNYFDYYYEIKIEDTKKKVLKR